MGVCVKESSSSPIKACTSKWGLGPGGLAHEYLLRELSWEPPECQVQTSTDDSTVGRIINATAIAAWYTLVDQPSWASRDLQWKMPNPVICKHRLEPWAAAAALCSEAAASRPAPSAGQTTHRGRRRYQRCAPLASRGGAGAAARPQAKGRLVYGDKLFCLAWWK